MRKGSLLVITILLVLMLAGAGVLFGLRSPDDEAFGADVIAQMSGGDIDE